jgi:hypothetical protein
MLVGPYTPSPTGQCRPGPGQEFSGFAGSHPQEENGGISYPDSSPTGLFDFSSLKNKLQPLSGYSVAAGAGQESEGLGGWLDRLMSQLRSLLQDYLPSQGENPMGLGQMPAAAGGNFQNLTPMVEPLTGTMPQGNVEVSKLEPVTHTAPVGGGPSAGSGPYTFNITNSQEQPITLGMFDKNEQLTGEITLQPGQTGQMRYQSDFTGLIKQANADGGYQPDASRLEFYNGFINTSYIDGRNAAIHATDHNGFEIGDKESILDKAPTHLVSRDSGGNGTITGWYDGSTSEMTQAGEFLTNELGTGMSYIHPNDDQLGEGHNPMRMSHSMTLDVVFGKP